VHLPGIKSYARLADNGCVEPAPSPQPDLDQENRPTVLVADDDHDLVNYIKIRLEHAGYDVLTTDDGEDALRLALERKPDVAVLDVRMPTLDGFGVTRQIRSNESVSEMPVILLTGSVLADDVAMGEEVGANEYLMKPLSEPEELLDTVRSALNRG
jgi:two-component system alkaline phosphatase synthesis response regulator PhoP